MKKAIVIGIAALIIITGAVYLVGANDDLRNSLNVCNQNLEEVQTIEYEHLKGLYVYNYEDDNDEENKNSKQYNLYLYEDGKYVYEVYDNNSLKILKSNIGYYIIKNNTEIDLNHIFKVNEDNTLTKDNSITNLKIDEGYILESKDDNHEIEFMKDETKDNDKDYLNNGNNSFSHYINLKVKN